MASGGKTSQRQRDLPAHVVVYDVMALSLFMQASSREVLRCLVEGLHWLHLGIGLKIAGKSGISQARTRLGAEVMRNLHDTLVVPIATPATKGAFYKQWRLVSLDGSTLDVDDNPKNETAFGRPGGSHGEPAFPQIRFVALVETGTRVLFGTQVAGCGASEIALARDVVPNLVRGMLCLADRNFFGFDIWRRAGASGADRLWRIKTNARLPVEQTLPDGSYLSHVYPSERDRRLKTNGVKVRVINYRLEGVAASEPLDRLATSILDHDMAPAAELAALYHERWDIETTIGEIKTTLRGAKIVMRSKTPDLVIQEVHGLLMTHFAIRGVMHEAAIKADDDPDRLSFIHAVRVIRRKIMAFGAISP